MQQTNITPSTGNTMGNLWDFTPQGQTHAADSSAADTYMRELQSHLHVDASGFTTDSHTLTGSEAGMLAEITAVGSSQYFTGSVSDLPYFGDPPALRSDIVRLESAITRLAEFVRNLSDKISEGLARAS